MCTGILYYVSSTLNPILYSVMSHRYRRALRDTVCPSRSDGGPPSSRRRRSSPSCLCRRRDASSRDGGHTQYNSPAFIYELDRPLPARRLGGKTARSIGLWTGYARGVEGRQSAIRLVQRQRALSQHRRTVKPKFHGSSFVWHPRSRCYGVRTFRRQDVTPTDITPTMSDVSPTNRPMRGLCERSRQLRVTSESLRSKGIKWLFLLTIQRPNCKLTKLELEWNGRTGTDRRTDGDDCISSHANTVGIIPLGVTRMSLTRYEEIGRARRVTKMLRETDAVEFWLKAVRKYKIK